MTEEIAQRTDGREYPERPIVGVGAVVFFGDSVLLIQRGREPMKGRWSLPGGALELGERIEDGVVREVREEAGVEVRPLELVEVVDRILRDDAGEVQFHYVLLDWLCTVARPDGAAVIAGSDARAAVWAPFEELQSFGLDALTTTVIRRAADRAKDLEL